MRKLVTILTLLTIQLAAYSQNNIPALDNYLKEIRAGRQLSVPKEIAQHDRPSVVLGALLPYFNDTVALIRAKAYTLTQLIGIRSQEPPIRQQSVQMLTAGCKDLNSGNVGFVLGYLTTFKKGDFTTESKDNIKLLMTSRALHMDKVMKLAGFLELVDQTGIIRPYTQPGNNRRDRWAALVALTRMGDPVALQDLVDRVKKLKINDDVVEDVFPDLVYTRQKVALDYMVEVLKSDEKNCTSAGESGGAIPCAYRVMEQLAKAVKGYPLELDASGDIETKDYKKALATARAWFDMHKDYEIDRDTY